MRTNESRFEKPGDEGAGACEWVEHVDSGVCNGGVVEVCVESCFDASQDEVDDLDWRVNNSERFGHFGEGDREEVAVEVFDDALPGGSVVFRYALYTPLNRLVELVEVLGFGVKVVAVENVDHSLHGV